MHAIKKDGSSYIFSLRYIDSLRYTVHPTYREPHIMLLEMI